MAVSYYLVFFLVAMAWFQLWYFLPNAFFYWLFWRHESFERQRIQADRRPRRNQIRVEIMRSVRTLTIYSVIAVFCFWCYRNGYTMVDTDFIGGGKLILSVVVAIVLFDTWFYWFHRLLHWKPLYRRFHRQHHESFTPTPWASSAFSCTEAVLMCPLWVFCFGFPCHPLAILIGLVIQNIHGVFGHLGYEFFPHRMLCSKLACSIQATPTRHDSHHRYLRGNYGHYFNLWDVLMRTELKQYQPLREVVYEQTGRLPSASPEVKAAPATDSPPIPTFPETASSSFDMMSGSDL